MKQNPQHRKSTSTSVIQPWVAVAVLVGIVVYQQLGLTKLKHEIESMRSEITANRERQEDSRERLLKSEARETMFAICKLAEFAGSGAEVSGGSQLTIRLAEEELLHFMKVYVNPAGDPMAQLLLYSDEEYHIGFNKEGKYHSALDAVSIAVELAKTSTSPHIEPDGLTRHLLEHIHRWLTKRSQTE
jgi:hypothetical protein